MVFGKMYGLVLGYNNMYVHAHSPQRNMMLFMLACVTTRTTRGDSALDLNRT